MEGTEKQYQSDNVQGGHHQAGLLLKVLAIGILILGALACLGSWPDSDDGRLQIPLVVYAIPLGYALGGIISAGFFWGISAIIDRLSEILWLQCTPEQRKNIFGNHKRPPI